MKLNMSKKLSIATASLILIICISLGLITVFITSLSLKSQAESSLKKTAKSASYQVLSIIDKKVKILTELSYRSEIKSMEYSLVKANFEADIKRLAFEDFALVNRNGEGKFILSEKSENFKANSEFLLALSGRATYSDVFIDSEINKPMMYLYTPVEVDGISRGLLVAKINAEFLSTLTFTLGITKVGDAFLINEKGTIVGHPNRNFVLESLNPIEKSVNDKNYNTFSNAVKLVLDRKEGIMNIALMG